MNADKDNMDPAMDLGLRLGYSSDFIQRTLNIESGAGVNAGLRVNIPFGATNPLSELVWSPHNGLSIKCAESPFVDRSSSILLGAGQSNDKPMDENLLTARATIHVIEEVAEGCSRNEVGITPMGESSHECGRGHEIVGETADVLPHKSDEVKSKDFGSPSGGMDVEILGKKIALTSNVPPINECEASNFTTTDLISQGTKRRAEQASIVAEKSKSKVNKYLQKDEEALPMDKILSANRKVERWRRKGKEKALSDGDVHGRMSKEEGSTSSHGSVESCNSAKLFPRGKKRWVFEQLITQSKRAKMEIQESQSLVRKDSSFMSWISNMVKGFGKPVEEKELSVPFAHAQPPHHGHEHTVLREKTQDTGSLNMKSLYCSNTMVNDSRQSTETDHVEGAVSCKQFVLSKEKFNESMSITEAGLSTMPKIPSHSTQENCKASPAENKNSPALVLGKENEGMSSKLSLGKHNTNNITEKNDSDLLSKGNTTHILSNRSDALRSLWVTRFSPKTVDANICKLGSDLPSQRRESSEAMTSMFARRLDAIKHIIPSGVTDDAATACFFCGITGHRLRECQEITENELEDLLMNIKLHSGAAESSRLCIRCFQLDHWAVSCPNASTEPCQMEGSTSKQRHIRTSDRMISGSTVVNKCIASSSLKNESREERIGPLSILNMPMGIFDAMKRLRLSRSDILKWMSSDMSLSHLDGFFLRLRLGKWEEGLGGTGYYVACIDGSEVESLSRNVIPVKVGSIKCLVGSQYISNQDFRDDELMAWWSAALRNGGQIPSEEDLRARVHEKKMLRL